MNARRLFALASLSLLALGNTCGKERDTAPTPALTAGRLRKVELTFDSRGQHPRPRWLVDTAPLALEGLGGALYQRAKVFDLPDTATYRVGRAITFHYQLVPLAQQTPWKTSYEWWNMAATMNEADTLPEITLTDVSVVKSE